MNRKNFLKTVGAGSLGLALSPLSLLYDKIRISDSRESEKKAEIVLHFKGGKCLRFKDGTISSRDGAPIVTNPDILEKLNDIWNKVKNWHKDDNSKAQFENYGSIVNEVDDMILEIGARCMVVRSNDKNQNTYYFNPVTVGAKLNECIEIF